MLFKSTVLVITLGTGQSIICRALVNPQLEYFLSHDLDMGAVPGGIYTKGIRMIGGTTNANLTLTPYHIWDTTDTVITPICNQQIISIALPTDALIDKFLTAIGQSNIKSELEYSDTTL